MLADTVKWYVTQQNDFVVVFTKDAKMFFRVLVHPA